MIGIDKWQTTGIITLQGKRNNSINHEFIDSVTEALYQIEKDARLNSALITSSKDNFFSAGFDLPSLLKLDRKAFSLFVKSFNDLCLYLFSYPKPLIASVNGHALGEGCLLALCCDYRFISKEKTLMGLNQVKLGLPVLFPIDQVLVYKFGYKISRDLMESGEIYPPENVMIWGLVEEVCDKEMVISKALDKAAQLHKIPGTTYIFLKRNRVEFLLESIKGSREKKEDEFVDIWFSSQVQKELRKESKKFVHA